MELYQLRYFYALCRHGRFSRAAEELYISPSTMTRAIKRLESELGQDLIDRDSVNFMLTPTGEALLDSCSRILSELDSFSKKAARLSLNKNVLKLNAEYILCTREFIDIINRYVILHPEMYIWLVKHCIDMTLPCTDATVSISIGIRPEKLNRKLEYRPFLSKDYALLVGSLHPLFSCRCITPAIMSDPLSRIRVINIAGELERIVVRYFAAHRARLLPSQILCLDNDDYNGIVENGSAVALVPCDHKPLTSSLRVIPFEHRLSIDYCFVTSKAYPFTKQALQLMDFLVGRV